MPDSPSVATVTATVTETALKIQDIVGRPRQNSNGNTRTRTHTDGDRDRDRDGDSLRRRCNASGGTTPDVLPDVYDDPCELRRIARHRAELGGLADRPEAWGRADVVYGSPSPRLPVSPSSLFAVLISLGMDRGRMGGGRGAGCPRCAVLDPMFS